MSFPLSGLTLAMDFQNKGSKTLEMLNELDKIVKKIMEEFILQKIAGWKKTVLKVFIVILKNFQSL